MSYVVQLPEDYVGTSIIWCDKGTDVTFNTTIREQK
jgi:hypothetical protein